MPPCNQVWVVYTIMFSSTTFTGSSAEMLVRGLDVTHSRPTVFCRQSRHDRRRDGKGPGPLYRLEVLLRRLGAEGEISQWQVPENIRRSHCR